MILLDLGMDFRHCFNYVLIEVVDERVYIGIRIVFVHSAAYVIEFYLVGFIN